MRRASDLVVSTEVTCLVLLPNNMSLFLSSPFLLFIQLSIALILGFQPTPSDRVRSSMETSPLARWFSMTATPAITCSAPPSSRASPRVSGTNHCPSVSVCFWHHSMKIWQWHCVANHLFLPVIEGNSLHDPLPAAEDQWL